MKRRIRRALWVYVAVVGVLGFFVLATYCIVTPGSTGTLFSDPRSTVDPTQARWAALWMLWGLVGSLAAGAFTTYPELQGDD